VPGNTQEIESAQSFQQESVETPTQPSPIAVEKSPTETEKTSLVSFNGIDLIMADDQDKGFILTASLHGYDQELVFHEILAMKNSQNLLFDKYLEKNKQKTTLLFKSKDVNITHSMINSDNSFIFNNLVKIENKTDSTWNDSLWINAGSINLKKRDIHSRFIEAFIFTNDGITRFNPFGKTPAINGSVKAIGLRDRHFCTVIKPKSEDNISFHLEKHDKNNISLYLILNNVINSKQVKEIEFSSYIGPQLADNLAAMGENIKEIVNFGFFDPISKVILYVLRLFHAFTRNWGVAIILLSAALFFVVYPLTAKQMNSLKRMQEVQPEIEKIRKAYKDNPQKLNKEMLGIYKTYKINPAGGCLPMILQIPIFFALYQALLRSVEIYGANFLWIKDLSEPDKLSLMGGGSVNLLPLIMAVGMFFQQKISQQKSSGAMAEQQKMMVWIMPVMFGFIFYNFPSGLVLYWLFNSVFTTIAQWKTLKKAS